MLTDQDIQKLIELPKAIVARVPSKGFKEDRGYKRCDLDLLAETDPSTRFAVFIRQNTNFVENFSIGLRYRTDDRSLGTVTLVRYNGPHGEISRDLDGHYAKPHIHRITADEIASGSVQPQESHREITNRYSTYEQALMVFFDDIAISNRGDYFPELLQGRLFNGH
jgi:hypothetical protein